MKNLNEKRMPFILFMVAFIGCVSLFIACSSETDNEINEDKQEETTLIKTRGASLLPEGKVVVSVDGSWFRYSWNAILFDCGWGPNVYLYSSNYKYLARTAYRYYEKEMTSEIQIEERFMGKDWGTLTAVISACGNQEIKVPLTQTGPSTYTGELTKCVHRFEGRETSVDIKASNYGADITTGLSRSGRMVVEAKVKDINNTDKEVSRVFETFIRGDQTTHFSWDWGVSTLHMGTVYITIRIYDRNCTNVDCNNYLEKTFSWSVPNSHGKYNASGSLNVIGG